MQRKATPPTPPQTTAAPASKPVTRNVQRKPRVQRHTAEPIDTAEPVEPASSETPSVPSAATESYAPQEMPFVQRQPLEPKSVATPAQSTVVQRSVLPDETEAAPQLTSDLSERILSRVAPPERRVVTKPIDLPLHHTPLPRESQPETITSSPLAAGEYHSTPSAPSSITASPAPAIQRMTEPAIQRTPSESETSSSDAGFIQRVESVPAITAEAAEAVKPPDLDQLARQVYPLIKRMIAIERERRAFR